MWVWPVDTEVYCSYFFQRAGILIYTRRAIRNSNQHFRSSCHRHCSRSWRQLLPWMNKSNAWRREPKTYHIPEALEASFWSESSAIISGLFLSYAVRVSSLWCDLLSLTCQLMAIIFFSLFYIFLQWLNYSCRCWQTILWFYVLASWQIWNILVFSWETLILMTVVYSLT